jgi:hypothetical protein
VQQFNIKAGDVLPVLKASLKNTSGEPLDLSLASGVNLRVRQYVRSGSPVKWSKPCVITSAPLGVVEYHWASGDTTTAGTFEVEFVVTWQDGSVQTVPNNGNAIVQINPTLA